MNRRISNPMTVSVSEPTIVKCLYWEIADCGPECDVSVWELESPGSKVRRSGLAAPARPLITLSIVLAQILSLSKSNSFTGAYALIAGGRHLSMSYCYHPIQCWGVLIPLADFIEKSGAFTKTGAPRPARTIPTFEEEPEAEEVSSDGETDDEDDDEDAA
ncbi:hypothetical protein DFH06DRAFT_1138729 [Mycena polygramma]|nr:hypothetical protein DFH06DRAFT_1138729 [Mycena polygramma]